MARCSSPETKIGTFSQTLDDEAKKQRWTVTRTRNDRKRVSALDG